MKNTNCDFVDSRKFRLEMCSYSNKLTFPTSKNPSNLNKLMCGNQTKPESTQA